MSRTDPRTAAWRPPEISQRSKLSMPLAPYEICGEEWVRRRET
jgi:hypothetical protein